MLRLEVTSHPSLFAGAFVTRFDRPLGEVDPKSLAAGLRLEASAPIERSEAIRASVRDLLRHGGYKPTGRGKPASEYLVQAAERGTLGSINAAVDACNAASLHSGLPISVVDLERCRPPLRIAVAGAEQYVFNESRQTIDVEGLLCLFDGEGPCANAVKDSQRTKTSEATRSTLSVVWGPSEHRAHVERTVAWYRSLLEGAGARTEDVELATER